MTGSRHTYIQSSAPHIRTAESVSGIYWKRAAALSLAWMAWTVLWGWNVIWITLGSLSASLLAEIVSSLLLRKKFRPRDGSSFYTGVLFIFLVPPTTPLWMIFCASFFAVFIGKEMFGGVGNYLFHPALIGYAFLWSCFPDVMESASHAYQQAMSAAPQAVRLFDQSVGVPHLFLLFALVGGGIFMSWKRMFYWELPWIYFAFLIVLSLAFFQSHPFFSVSSIFAAFFLITEPVTTPLSRSGMRVFAVLCALAAVILNHWASIESSIYFSVLMMNAGVPWLDRWLKPQAVSKVFLKDLPGSFKS